jgi:sugar phosphate permease
MFSASELRHLTSNRYAVGILFLTPLGDLLRRRQLVLALLGTTALLSIGLASAESLVAFEVLAFFVGVFTVSLLACYLSLSDWHAHRLLRK